MSNTVNIELEFKGKQPPKEIDRACVIAHGDAGIEAWIAEREKAGLVMFARLSAIHPGFKKATYVVTFESVPAEEGRR